MAWKDHLLNMDYLRDSVGLRAYGQKRPLDEYKREGFEMFQTMLEGFNFEALKRFFEVEPISSEEIDELEREKNQTDKVNYSDNTPIIDSDGEEPKDDKTPKKNLNKVVAGKEKAKRRKLRKQKRQQRRKQRK